MNIRIVMLSWHLHRYPLLARVEPRGAWGGSASLTSIVENYTKMAMDVFFFLVRLQCQKFQDVYYTVGKVFQDLSNSILQAHKFLKIQVVNKTKKNMHSFSDCRASWSKELQMGN
jgi:hypothetical protein